MVGIVIPVFNRVKFTLDCLQSLFSNHYDSMNIYLIDDGSVDGTSEQVAALYPAVKIINGDGNWWWTKSTNVGLRQAIADGCDYLVMLNNDTIATPNFISKLIAPVIQDNKTISGAFGIDSVSYKPIQTGQNINWLFAKMKSYPKDADSSFYAGLRPVTHLPGRGMAFYKQLIDDVGYMDEDRFPQYSADFDYTHRARRAGYRLFVNYDAPLHVFPDESGDLSNRERKTWSNYWNHLTGITGGGHLIRFMQFGLIHCPPVYWLPYFSIGLVRRLLGYWIK